MTKNFFYRFFIAGILSVTLLTSILVAAGKQSTIQSFEELKNAIAQVRSNARNATTMSEEPSEKCGLWLSFEITRLMPQLTAQQKAELNALLSPTSQKSRVIGRFEIFYDTTGNDSPAMLLPLGDDNYERIPGSHEEFVDSVGRYFNEVWNYEIDTLGYPAPPLDASNLYRVVIRELGIGLYGVTYSENRVQSMPIPRYQTFIEIDNDFQLVYSATRGMPALKVTAAHEFHHAIQIGGYGVRNDERFFYEITSTWMEEVVYNDVNDYYQYQSNSPTRNSQFSRPDLNFRRADGEIEYSRSVWGKFIEKRYSPEVMKSSWEYFPQAFALNAIDHALNDIGASFHQAFVEFSFWNSNTGVGADTVMYYSEGRHYPQMRMRPMIEYQYMHRSVEDTLESVSSLYYPICSRRTAEEPCGSAIQMEAIIINLNLSAGDIKHPFRYLMDPQGDDTYKLLSNGMYVKVDVPDFANWTSIESAPPIVNEVVVYPNPIKADGRKSLTFRIPSVIQETGLLYIFSSSMDRIFASERPVEFRRPFEPALTWDGRNEHGDIVSSGVYFFVIQIDGKDYKGKFAIVRD